MALSPGLIDAVNHHRDLLTSMDEQLRFLTERVAKLEALVMGDSPNVPTESIHSYEVAREMPKRAL